MPRTKCPHCRSVTTDEELASYAGHCINCRTSSASQATAEADPLSSPTQRPGILAALIFFVLAVISALPAFLFLVDAFRLDAKYGSATSAATETGSVMSTTADKELWIGVICAGRMVAFFLP